MSNNNNLKNATDYDYIIKTPDEKCFPNSGGLGKLIFSYLTNNGDSIAQIDAITGEKDPYPSYLKRCIRTAIRFRSKGITSEDIISICSFNHLNTIIPFFASLFLGIKTAKIDTTLSVDEISQLLVQLRSKLIFVSTDCVDLIAKSVEIAGTDTEIIVFGETSEYASFSEFLEKSDQEDSFEPVEITNLQETAVILFSSGSTGLPKGVCLHHYGFLCIVYDYTQFPLKNFTALLFSSLYWVSQITTILGVIVNNGTLVVVPGYDKNILWDLVEKYQVHFMFMSPSQAIAWRKLGRPDDISIALRLVVVAGATISEEQLQSLNAMVPESIVLQAWGMTELSGRGTMFDITSWHLLDKKIRHKTVGWIPPGMTYKVVDPDTEEALGPNKPGELRIKSRYIMNGYFGLDSSDCFDSEGWFKTGDLVYYDENKFLFIVERIKDIIEFKTHDIYPSNIERVILGHPSVQFAVVIGIPDLDDLEHPAAAVVLKDFTKGNVTPEDIEKYVEERVTDQHKLRGGVVIIEKFPEVTSGKVRKLALQKMIMEKRNQ